MKFTPKKLRNEAELSKNRETLKAQLAAAQALNDPADRLEAMLKLEHDVSTHASKIYGPMIDRTMLADIGSIVGTIATAVGTGAILCAVATPLVGIPAMVALLGGGIYGTIKYDLSEIMMKRMEKEMSVHLGALNDILETSGKDVQNLLKTSTNEIAASEKFDSLYDRYPDIRNSFIKAFNKAVALKELPPPPTPPNSTRKLAL